MLEIKDKIRVNRVACPHGVDLELKTVSEIAENSYTITVNQAVCQQCLFEMMYGRDAGPWPFGYSSRAGEKEK